MHPIFVPEPRPREQTKMAQDSPLCHIRLPPQRLQRLGALAVPVEEVEGEHQHVLTHASRELLQVPRPAPKRDSLPQKDLGGRKGQREEIGARALAERMSSSSCACCSADVTAQLRRRRPCSPGKRKAPGHRSQARGLCRSRGTRRRITCKHRGIGRGRC